MYVLVKYSKLCDCKKTKESPGCEKSGKHIASLSYNLPGEEQLLDISCLRGLNTETVSKELVEKVAHPSKMVFLCAGSEPCLL